MTSVIIYVLTIHTNITNFGTANGRASQDALPALFDDAAVHNVCHPFDLNHPQQDSEQENLLTGDYFQSVTQA